MRVLTRAALESDELSDAGWRFPIAAQFDLTAISGIRLFAKNVDVHYSQ